MSSRKESFKLEELLLDPAFDPDHWEECQDEDSAILIWWWRFLGSMIAITVVGFVYHLLESHKEKSEEEEGGASVETRYTLNNSSAHHESYGREESSILPVDVSSAQRFAPPHLSPVQKFHEAGVEAPTVEDSKVGATAATPQQPPESQDRAVPPGTELDAEFERIASELANQAEAALKEIESEEEEEEVRVFSQTISSGGGKSEGDQVFLRMKHRGVEFAEDATSDDNDSAVNVPAPAITVDEAPGSHGDQEFWANQEEEKRREEEERAERESAPVQRFREPEQEPPSPKNVPEEENASQEAGNVPIPIRVEDPPIVAQTETRVTAAQPCPVDASVEEMNRKNASLSETPIIQDTGSQVVGKIASAVDDMVHLATEFIASQGNEKQSEDTAQAKVVNKDDSGNRHVSESTSTPVTPHVQSELHSKQQETTTATDAVNEGGDTTIGKMSSTLEGMVSFATGFLHSQGTEAKSSDEAQVNESRQDVETIDAARNDSELVFHGPQVVKTAYQTDLVPTSNQAEASAQRSEGLSPHESAREDMALISESQVGERSKTDKSREEMRSAEHQELVARTVGSREEPPAVSEQVKRADASKRLADLEPEPLSIEESSAAKQSDSVSKEDSHTESRFSELNMAKSHEESITRTTTTSSVQATKQVTIQSHLGQSDAEIAAKSSQSITVAGSQETKAIQDVESTELSESKFSQKQTSSLAEKATQETAAARESTATQVKSSISSTQQSTSVQETQEQAGALEKASDNVPKTTAVDQSKVVEDTTATMTAVQASQSTTSSQETGNVRLETEGTIETKNTTKISKKAQAAASEQAAAAASEQSTEVKTEGAIESVTATKSVKAAASGSVQATEIKTEGIIESKTKTKSKIATSGEQTTAVSAEEAVEAKTTTKSIKATASGSAQATEDKTEGTIESKAKSKKATASESAGAASTEKSSTKIEVSGLEGTKQEESQKPSEAMDKSQTPNSGSDAARMDGVPQNETLKSPAEALLARMDNLAQDTKTKGEKKTTKKAEEKKAKEASPEKKKKEVQQDLPKLNMEETGAVVDFRRGSTPSSAHSDSSEARLRFAEQAQPVLSQDLPPSDDDEPSATTAPEIESYAAEAGTSERKARHRGGLKAQKTEEAEDVEDLPLDGIPVDIRQEIESLRQSSREGSAPQMASNIAEASGVRITRNRSPLKDFSTGLTEDDSTSEKLSSVLSVVGVTSMQEALQRIQTLNEVSDIMRRAGLETSNLIFGIDYTASNKYQGEKCFGGRSLHSIDPDVYNPYQQVIRIMGKTLAPFCTSGQIPAFGFGDVHTSDWSVFSLKQALREHSARDPGDISHHLLSTEACTSFDEVLAVYNAVTPKTILSGPTNFAPLILQAIDICKQHRDYHILVIVADGQVTNERATRRAIVEACKYPLSIIVVGVGDGPWDMMKVFDDSLPKRPWDNFHFVEFQKVVAETDAMGAGLDLSFAVHSLLEIPDQYKKIKSLGLLPQL